MARIYRRENVWYVDVRYKGRRIRKRVGTSKRMAELALKDAEVKIAREEFGFSKKDISIDELVQRVLEYNRTNHRESTAKRYKAGTDHLRRYLAEKRPDVVALSQLSTEVIEGFKAFRRDEWVNPNGKPVNGDEGVKDYTRKGARARTVNLELDAIKTMLNVARRWGYLKENPLSEVKPLKTDDKKPVQFLAVEECEKLLEAASSEFYPILFAFLNTGMRKAELENLRWEDVDFSRRKILVRAKEDWKPKTGEREIPLTDDLHDLLTELKHSCRKAKGVDYVFNVKASGRSHNWLRIELIRTAVRAEIPGLTKIHTLRHTFASHLVMNGVDLPTVGKLMGHSDVETTMIYAHLAPEHLTKAIGKLPFTRKL